MNNNCGHLPLDIVSDILLRLPIKSIGRSRCVSKSWLSLISESQFVKTHLHRSISNSSNDDDDNTRIIACDFKKIMLTYPSPQVQPPNPSGFPPNSVDYIVASCQVLGSCHGLFVVIVHNDEEDSDDKSIFVWNPCTREHRELPKLNINTLKNDTLLCDGIGYDSYSDDYKVLISASVFSLKSNSWKTLTNIPCDYHGFQEVGVVFDGSLYWMARHNTMVVILTFDLDTEQYLESPQLQLPPVPDGLYYKCLFVMGTCLSIFLCGHLQDEHEVWMMKKQGAESVWTKSFVLVYKWFTDFVRPICLLKSGELLLHADDYGLVLYNPIDGTTTDIFSEDFTIYNVNSYIESLVSPYTVYETGLGEQ